MHYHLLYLTKNIIYLIELLPPSLTRLHNAEQVVSLHYTLFRSLHLMRNKMLIAVAASPGIELEQVSLKLASQIRHSLGLRT
jgi:hypothetical protein